MRFYDLKGLSDEDASKLITESQKVEMKEFLYNPVPKKILVFRGNYDGFATNRLCARTFEYLPDEARWQVVDFTIYDMFGSGFAYHFSSSELELQFKGFCNSKAFVMDA